MRYYLDTNILECLRAPRMSELDNNVLELLMDYSNMLLTSSVCVHELIHLAQIGKLGGRKNAPTPEEVFKWIDTTGIEIIPVSRLHLKEYAALPFYDDHRDPNDWLIIAQAISDHIPLVSSDHKFSKYGRYGLDFIFNER